MATDLLADGIRRFAADTEKLEAFLRTKLYSCLFHETNHCANSFYHLF